MMRLRFLHPPPPILIAEKQQDLIEELLRIIEDVGKRPTLAILQELIATYEYFRHF